MSVKSKQIERELSQVGSPAADAKMGYEGQNVTGDLHLWKKGGRRKIRQREKQACLTKPMPAEKKVAVQILFGKISRKCNLDIVAIKQPSDGLAFRT